MAKTTTADNAPENNKTPENNAPKKSVRVICNGTLGDKLLKKGDVTSDEEYVALLKTKRGRTLVEEVK